MMVPIPLTITNAGLQAFTAAQLGGDIDLAIATVGFTDAVFTVAPTLTALPGEFKRLATVSGTVTAADTVHMLVRDTDAATYTVRGFGLFLADGTLFAVYGQAEPLVEKALLSIVMLALDLRFPPEQVAAITFGDANFLNPLATETVAGVAEIATAEEVAAAVDDARIVTPKKLGERLADLLPKAATETAAGVAEIATADEVAAAADDARIVSPKKLGGRLSLLIPAGLITLFFGADAPAGWAICDGRTVQRVDGTGPITTPDLRGRVAVGVSSDHALGSAFGASSKTVTTKNAGSHTHAKGDLQVAIAGAQTGVTLQGGTNSSYAGNGTQTAVNAVPTLTDPGHAHTATVSGSTAEAGVHAHDLDVDTTQPSLALNYIMKL